MAATISVLINKKAQGAVIEYYKQCYRMHQQQWDMRSMMQQIDRQIMRETNYSVEQRRAKLANRLGDKSKLQDVTVPVILPQLEAAVAYQSSVFLTGTPIFGTVAEPKYQAEAVQMQTVIAENASRGGWVRELQMFIRDGFKYNLSALECTWDRTTTYAIETDLSFSNTVGKPKQVIWEGNCLRRWSMYNTFFDTRVDPSDIPTNGEFVGKVEFMSRIALMQLLNSLADRKLPNDQAALESNYSGGTASSITNNFFIPDLNPEALIRKDLYLGTDWLAWSGLVSDNANNRVNYSNGFEVAIMYGRIVPNDFGLAVPARGTPQVWKFIIVNNQVVILAERQTNAHELIPVLFGQPLEDGLGYQTKSFTQNLEPYQDISTTLYNSAIAARRRAISDRGLFNPLYVNEADINSPNPSAKIPIRPAAYGKTFDQVYKAIPFEDRNSSVALQEASAISAMAEKASGQNAAQQGQFTKGNRTLQEYADVMSHASGRAQMTAMLLESQVFTPVKRILKLNILQYQGGTSLYSPDTDQNVQIDPVALRKAVIDFKITDGLTPASKEISGDEFMVALQQIGQPNSTIAAEYNVGPLFTYLMSTRGADLTPFQKDPTQVAYEKAVQQWQQLAEAAIQKGAPFNTPQPLPQQYNYNPQTGGPIVANPSAAPTSTILDQIIATDKPAPSPGSAQQQQQPQQQPTGTSPNGNPNTQ